MEQKISEKYSELFHYTHFNGLRGIIESDVLRATEYKWLNDATEVLHIKNKIKILLSRIFESNIFKAVNDGQLDLFKINKEGGVQSLASLEAENTASMMMQTMLNEINGNNPLLIPYIASFCVHKEDEYAYRNGLLSQWRAYSKVNFGFEGCAVVFDTKEIEALAEEEYSQYGYLFISIADVIYDNSASKFPIEFSKLESLCYRYVREFFENKFDIKKVGAIPKILDPLAKAACRFKHEAFSEEKEVRIIACPEFVESLNDDNRKKFEVSENFKKPRKRVLNHRALQVGRYIELFDEKSGSHRLPITRVIVGPHSNQLSLYQKVRDLVSKYGIEVTRSETPLVIQGD